jgi:NAD(P)-dependent dehydrogenase (short-subunit alcohol dehydrogenase family)
MTPRTPRAPLSTGSAGSTSSSNNAGNFYAGFFEEITPEDFRAQVETTMFGPMNVTRAVLPVMRAQRSGLVMAISSTAGIVGQEFCTAYAASQVRGGGLD